MFTEIEMKTKDTVFSFARIETNNNVTGSCTVVDFNLFHVRTAVDGTIHDTLIPNYHEAIAYITRAISDFTDNAIIMDWIKSTVKENLLMVMYHYTDN